MFVLMLTITDVFIGINYLKGNLHDFFLPQWKMPSESRKSQLSNKKKRMSKKKFLAELWLFKVEVFRRAQKRKFQCGGEQGA